MAMVTVTVMLGLIMAIIDATIVNVALPTMAGNLGATTDEIAWVVTAYILANVIIMPLNGWLTAMFGRQRYYATCVAAFTIASALCGFAGNIWLLVIFRVLQGLGGGALQPTAQSILFESYPPEKRGNAMAIFGLGAMVGPAIGPVLGGYIVDNWSWPVIFFINIPIGILAFLMTYMFIRDPSYIEKPEGKVDWPGLAYMTVGISAMQYVLERGQHDDWFDSDAILILTIVSAVAIGLFIYRELRIKNPVVDLFVFRSRTFAIGNIIGVISGFGLFGLNLILPLFFQNVLGFDALQAGLALLPGALATAISMPIAGRLMTKIDGRVSIAAGLLIFGAASWWMGGLDQNSGYWDIFWPRAYQGFALGFLFVPLSTATLSGVPRGELASASGMYTLIRQLGGSLGIAILTTLLQREIAIAQQALAAGVTLSSPAVRDFLNNPST
ncbi:MAG: DHA2 family efflux MFS transporter permease subunit, partial [Candidatus Eremiobacteraeota bacterium]|nr:DHA2 family efflux MFS transporter permease subunit [Candidatus Eremiobacteraeota bacterium]